jgi:16S rRNA (cytidine1402-2'-O)-methyltransferase
MSADRGVLVVVGTPIGNLGDLSPRAVEALRDADVIACEDTRRTGRLLERAGVRARGFVVVNDHTEATRIGEVIERLRRGERVAVVTDAGMPGISDPGERLVRAATAEGFEVEVVPGPSALVAGLVVSGLPTGRFAFEGFLPRKGRSRTERLAMLASEQRTLVLFEAPHRLARTLADLADALDAARRVVLARELTKLHEEVWRGTLGEALRYVQEVEPRGEYVLVIEGAPPVDGPTDREIADALERQVNAGRSTRDAVAEVARELGVSRRRVYDLATRHG